MRILQVVHGFPPQAWAGTELLTFYLSHALSARGHEIGVFARTEDLKAKEFTFREEGLEGLRIFRVVHNYTHKTSFRLSYDNPFFYEPFVRLLENLKPQVVHFQHTAHLSTTLITLARSLGYPTVLSLHDFFFFCPLLHLIDSKGQLCPGPEGGKRCASCLQIPPEETRQRFSLMEKTLRLADQILVPSGFMAKKIQSYLPCLKGQIRVVPPGVEPLSTPAENRLPPPPVRILYVGPLLPHKGAHVLLEALRGLSPRNFTASLYGAEVPFWQSYTQSLREKAQGLSVQFCGTYPHSQLASIFSRHDVLVVPSVCEETFSLVTHEALSAGLPVLAARRGALPEAVQSGVNGLFFEPENAIDLRRCLKRLGEEPGLLEKLSGRPVRVPTLKEYARQVEDVYRELTPDGQKKRKGKLNRPHHETHTGKGLSCKSKCLYSHL